MDWLTTDFPATAAYGQTLIASLRRTRLRSEVTVQPSLGSVADIVEIAPLGLAIEERGVGDELARTARAVVEGLAGQEQPRLVPRDEVARGRVVEAGLQEAATIGGGLEDRDPGATRAMPHQRADRRREGLDRAAGAGRLFAIAVGIGVAHRELLAVPGAPSRRIGDVGGAEEAGAARLAVPAGRRREHVAQVPVGDDVRGVEEAAVPALTDLLAEGRSGDDLRRFRPREARAAVARGERQHGVVPAGEIFLGLAPAGMVVRLVLVVEERLDPGSILGPGRRDPALVVVGRGIGLARRGQHDPAIELQLVEAFAAQGAVLVMHPEKHDPSRNARTGA